MLMMFHSEPHQIHDQVHAAGHDLAGGLHQDTQDYQPLPVGHFETDGSYFWAVDGTYRDPESGNVLRSAGGDMTWEQGSSGYYYQCAPDGSYTGNYAHG
jgi:hypothetical protein